jgi:hypothetical protein
MKILPRALPEDMIAYQHDDAFAVFGIGYSDAFTDRYCGVRLG